MSLVKTMVSVEHHNKWFRIVYFLSHTSKDFTIQALPVLKPQKKFNSIIIFYFYLYLLIQALPVLTSVGRGKPLLKVTVGGEIVSYYHIIYNIHIKNCAELCICICIYTNWSLWSTAKMCNCCFSNLSFVIADGPKKKSLMVVKLRSNRHRTSYSLSANGCWAGV